MSNKGDLQVWWIPQIPGKAFEVSVKDLEQAALIVDTLARYDAFQFEQNVKPDYSNAGGLRVFDGEEWIDWYSEDGEDFDYWRQSQAD